MTTTTRPTGAIAQVLDHEALALAARPYFAAQYDGRNPQHLTSAHRQMLIAVDRGLPAVVNHEGVGATQDEDGNVSVWLCSGMDLLPVSIPLDVIGATITGELIDLADGIRTFGARLDVNHAEWCRRYDHDYNPENF